MTDRPSADHRSAYVHFQTMTTRWMDNDAYQHMNNATYYSFFDTAVTLYLIENGLLDVEKSPVVGLAVETMCRFFQPIAFPSKVAAGIRVGHLGKSSVRYEVGLFRDDDDVAAAQGHFIHVYVDRATNRPVALPEKFRSVIAALQK